MATTANKRVYLFLAASGILACSLFGILGSFYWIFDLFCHFRMQYLIFGLILFSLFFFCRPYNYFLLSVITIGLIVNIVDLVPYFQKKQNVHFVGQGIKVISINLNSLNNESEKLLSYLKKEDPDIVTLFELTPTWGKSVQDLKLLYPYGKAIQQTDNFGVGIISKYPLTNMKVFREELFETPFISAELKILEKDITIVAIHPFPPIGPDGTRSRDNYLEKVATYVSSQKNHVVVCGDFNITPWSKTFKRFVETSGLVLSKNFGVIATWPTAFSPLRIPIDHCMVSKGLSIKKYARGPHIGSDHFPIELEFNLEDTRLRSNN